MVPQIIQTRGQARSQGLLLLGHRGPSRTGPWGRGWPGETGFHVTFTLIQCSCFLCVTAGTFAIERAHGVHALSWRGTSGGSSLTLVHISKIKNSNSTETSFLKLINNSSSLNKGNHDPDSTWISDFKYRIF